MDFQTKMDGFIRDFVERENYAGSLRITLKDQIIYERQMGLADREGGIPFTEDSAFTFYSMSKPFCAIGLLRLCDEGLVELDAHPGRYLPEAEGFDSRVTLAMMLNHISGVPDCFRETDFREAFGPATPDRMREAVKLISSRPSYFEPGTGDCYANINYTVPALIIENVSGMPYAEYMKKRVFEPLGATALQVDMVDAVIPNRVQGYAKSPEGTIVRADRSLDWMMGGGDLIGRVEDVYCLNRAIKYRMLLSESAWKRVLTPSPLNQMGFGCTLKLRNGRLRITHNGGHTGFRTYHIQYPEEDLDLILLSNCGWGKLREHFEQALFEFYFNEKAEDATPMDVGYI